MSNVDSIPISHPAQRSRWGKACRSAILNDRNHVRVFSRPHGCSQEHSPHLSGLLLPPCRRLSVQIMAKPTYDSPRWIAQKNRIIEARGHLCQDCGLEQKSDWLHLQHTYYEPKREYDTYPDDTLKLLCPECHEHTTQALMTLNYTFGRFTADQVLEITESFQTAIAETADPATVSNWVCLCLADVRRGSITFAEVAK